MANLIRGQKIDLTKNNPAMKKLSLQINWNGHYESLSKINIFALPLNLSGEISKEQDILFYPQQKSNNTSSLLFSSEKKLDVFFDKVSVETSKFLIALNISNLHKETSFRGIHSLSAIIENGLTHEKMHEYHLETDSYSNSTVIVGEVYRYNSEWKFSAVNRGISGGINQLLTSHGLSMNPNQLQTMIHTDVIEKNNPKINLSKIELKKSGDSINLSKSNDKIGEISVNLNWNQHSSNQSKGIFQTLFSSNSVDLDLGCLYELKTGEKGVVQALGNAFGRLHASPYIKLDKDDRSGNSSDGENLNINGEKYHEFERILIFSYIYEGAANWSEVDGIVKIKQNGGPDIIVRLDNHVNGKNMCAIAMIENTADNNLKITKVSRYFSGHQELDRAFDWNMRWTAGKK